MSSRHYKVKCQLCEAIFEDDGLLLDCSNRHEPSLLVTEYAAERFEPERGLKGIDKYQCWLPVVRTLPGSGRTVTYQSERLCRITELPNLWIAFNGYWPDKGAALETATFKDLEAYTVLSRIPRKYKDVLVVASAGNTAAAFARACSINRIRCLIVIPESGLQRMQFAEPLDTCVRIVSLIGFTDYQDAITLAERVSRIAGFYAEGGVRNVARRDGLATTLLNAVDTIGRLPDYYYQAIGSGAGGIAVHEAAKRLVADGRFGRTLPRLMLSQNLPFIPIYLSWKSQRREFISLNTDDGKKQIVQIAAHVLSNRKPPYSIKGGVFDSLTESHGDMLVADNLETLHAARLFEDSEGVDIDPAGAVAFATLLKVARCGQIERDKTVLLNITGGGWYRLGLDKKLVPAKPDLQLDGSEEIAEKTLERIAMLFD